MSACRSPNSRVWLELHFFSPAHSLWLLDLKSDLSFLSLHLSLSLSFVVVAFKWDWISIVSPSNESLYLCLYLPLYLCLFWATLDLIVSPSSRVSPSFFSPMSASWAPVRNWTQASKAPSLNQHLSDLCCSFYIASDEATWKAEHNAVAPLGQTWEAARSIAHSSSHCLAPARLFRSL